MVQKQRAAVRRQSVSRTDSPAPASRRPSVLSNKSGLPEAIIRTVTPLPPAPDHISASTRIGPLPGWLLFWLFVSAFVVMWDAGYVLLRPHSMVGHADAAWYAPLWTPYVKYASIDKLYGEDGFNAYKAGQEGFNAAQSVMNLVEASVQLIILAAHREKEYYAAHVLSCVVLPVTAAKTVLYFLTEASTGWSHVRHVTEPLDWYFFYLTMNGLWIVVPALGALTVVFRVLTVG